MPNTHMDDLIARRLAAENKAREVVRSYYRVRQALGYMGLMMPILLIIAGELSDARIEPSFSDFFHTVSRDIFVGVMFAMGIFLLTYEGYDRQEGESLSDNWLSTIAGLAAFGVALFPNESPTGQIATLSQKLLGVEHSPVFHYASALLFFYCMAHFCLFKFAKTTDLARRKVYRACGWTIAGSCVALFVASYLKLKGAPDVSAFVVDHRLVFWIEAVGVWAFALSWLVKGHAEMALIDGVRRVMRQG
jgi:hypothetical protein